MPNRLVAYIDESGQRSSTARSSDCFIMSAAVFRRMENPTCLQFLAQLRRDLGRGINDPLSWKNIKTHGQRLHTSQQLGAATWLTVSSVVVCKRMFDAGTPRLPDEDTTYLYTLRFLLERLSWLARDNSTTLSYTLAHIIRFRVSRLREYENRLRAATTQIEWSVMEGPGLVDQPSRIEQLQLADLAASAIGAAFNRDPFGNTETRYIHELAPRLYRRPPGRLTSYGLKMHPLNPAALAAYPWVTSI